MSIEEDFATLFDGRRDAYGTAEGGCFRPDSGSVLNSTAYWYARHLEGVQPIGVYPLVPDGAQPDGWVCKWGCIDFDVQSDDHVTFDFATEDEAHDAACNLQTVLDELDVTSWIERTRSCGRHLWVFANAWVPARTMRRALIVASEIAQTPTREINPKAETLPAGKLGNYCRLPLPGAITNEYGIGSTQVIIYPSNAVYWIRVFVDSALLTRTSPSTLQAIADLYRPPSQAKRLAFSEAGEQMLRLAGHNGLNAKGLHIFEFGPLDGDRSRGLSYLARQCFLSGLDPETALMVCGSAEWQKFRGRADEERRLRELVEGAYGTSLST